MDCGDRGLGWEGTPGTPPQPRGAPRGAQLPWGRPLPPRGQASSRRRSPRPGAAPSPPPAPAAPRPAAAAGEKIGCVGGSGCTKPPPTHPVPFQALSPRCPRVVPSPLLPAPRAHLQGGRQRVRGTPKVTHTPYPPTPPRGLTGRHPDAGEDAEGGGAAGEQDAAGAVPQQHRHPCRHPPAPQLSRDGRGRLLPEALGGAEGGSLRGEGV